MYLELKWQQPNHGRARNTKKLLIQFSLASMCSMLHSQHEQSPQPVNHKQVVRLIDLYASFETNNHSFLTFSHDWMIILIFSR